MSLTLSKQKADKRSVRTARSVRSIVSVALRYALLTFLAGLFLVPFYLILRNSLATEQDIRLGVFFPNVLHFENIQELFSDGSVSILVGLQTSALMAVLGTVGQVLVTSLAAYAMARIPSRCSTVVFVAVLGTMMIPGAVTFLPTYIVISYIGWIGTLQGLIIPGLFSGFTTFLFRQFFLGFPRELEEAGRVDGLGYWGIYWRIVVPNSLPIFAALGITGLIANWNSFLWPLVNALNSDSGQTVQVVISTFMTSQTIILHELFMAAAIGILPLVLLFLFFQRYIVQGYTQSGLKG